jgi:zinc transport system permease protein
MSSLFFSLLASALLAGCAASVTSGIVGSYVVVKRIVFMSGSIAHSVLGGMGLCLWLNRRWGIEWVSPLGGAIVAAIVSALLIGWIHLRYRQREDTVIAALWSTGMAIGVIFVSLTPGYVAELMNFLFGNILWIASSDLWLLAGLDVVIVAAVALFHEKFVAVCFDEEQASLQGINVPFYYLLLLVLVGISVVILIQVVGAILVIAMLAIPPAIAGRWAHRLRPLMGISIGLGCLFTLAGLSCSYVWNWPPGATIALVAAIAYLTSLGTWKQNWHVPSPATQKLKTIERSSG